MKRVLVTGATGFIGHYCLPALVATGDEVHAVSSKVEAGVHQSVHWHQADLLDSVQATDVIRKVKPTHLLHLAWSVIPGKYLTDLHNFWWVQASLGLLHEFLKLGGQRAVIAGSCAEYDWRYGYCSEAVTPLSPISLYSNSKNALQSMVGAFMRQTGMSFAWGRVFFLYGPHEHPQRLVPFVIRSVLQGERVPCSHGNQVRDYLYVQDVAEAFVALLHSEVSGPVNIASGRPVSLKSLIYGITDQLGGQDLIDLGAIATPAGDPKFVVADVTRLTDEVGWQPKHDLVSGLEKTVNWWKEHLHTHPIGK